MIKIIVPAIPSSLNKFAGRKNSWEYREEKKEWSDNIMWLSKKQKPERPIEKTTVEITYYFPTKGRRDPDNYSGKVIMDGLVKGGILKDDSFQNVDLILKGRYDKENPRTEIVIKEGEYEK